MALHHVIKNFERLLEEQFDQGRSNSITLKSPGMYRTDLLPALKERFSGEFNVELSLGERTGTWIRFTAIQ